MIILKDYFGNDFWQEEEGVGIVEIILILVVLIAIVLLFRENIEKIVQSAFESINGNSDKIQEDITN